MAPRACRPAMRSGFPEGQPLGDQRRAEEDRVDADEDHEDGDGRSGPGDDDDADERQQDAEARGDTPALAAVNEGRDRHHDAQKRKARPTRTATVLTDVSGQNTRTSPTTRITSPPTILPVLRSAPAAFTNCTTPAKMRNRPAKIATRRTLPQMFASTMMPKMTATIPTASMTPQ